MFWDILKHLKTKYHVLQVVNGHILFSVPFQVNKFWVKLRQNEGSFNLDMINWFISAQIRHPETVQNRAHNCDQIKLTCCVLQLLY